MARIRTCLTLRAAKCVFNTLVQPLFDYSDSAWGELSEGCSQELQRLQNRAARIILQRMSSADTFNILKWTNLATRRSKNRCILVFRCLNNLVPDYLCEYFTRNSNIHNYNAREKHDLHLPNPNRELGKKTFRSSSSRHFRLK